MKSSKGFANNNHSIFFFYGLIKWAMEEKKSKWSDPKGEGNKKKVESTRSREA